MNIEAKLFFLPFCIKTFGTPFSWKSWLWIIFDFEKFSLKTCLTDWSTGFWGYSWLLTKGMKVFSKKSGRDRTSKAPGCGWRRYWSATFWLYFSIFRAWRSKLQFLVYNYWYFLVLLEYFDNINYLYVFIVIKIFFYWPKP